MSDKTISKMYSYKPLKNYIGLEGVTPVKHKDVFVGVEIELEMVHKNYTISSINRLEDGSLKIHGAEFVTIPIKLKYLEIELNRLFRGLNKNVLLSSRCSVHVHINVRDITFDQLKSLVLIYMLFERALYRFSGDRWSNNFCVPLTQCIYFPYNLLRTSIINVEWAKYTGLNILPIWKGEAGTKLGTIEFRQMKATMDSVYIIEWCNLITAIKRYAQSFSYEEIREQILNITDFNNFAFKIFGKWSTLLTQSELFKEDMEKYYSRVKFVIPKQTPIKHQISNELTFIHFDEIQPIVV